MQPTKCMSVHAMPSCICNSVWRLFSVLARLTICGSCRAIVRPSVHAVEKPSVTIVIGRLLLLLLLIQLLPRLAGIIMWVRECERGRLYGKKRAGWMVNKQCNCTAKLQFVCVRNVAFNQTGGPRHNFNLNKLYQCWDLVRGVGSFVALNLFKMYFKYTQIKNEHTLTHTLLIFIVVMKK